MNYHKFESVLDKIFVSMMFIFREGGLIGKDLWTIWNKYFLMLRLFLSEFFPTIYLILSAFVFLVSFSNRKDLHQIAQVSWTNELIVEQCSTFLSLSKDFLLKAGATLLYLSPDVVFEVVFESLPDQTPLNTDTHTHTHKHTYIKI